MPDLQVVDSEDPPPLPRASTVSTVSASRPSQSSDRGLVSDTEMAKASSKLAKRTNRRSSMPDVAVPGLPATFPTSTVGRNAQPQRQKAYSFDDMPMQQRKPMPGFPNV